MSETEISSLEPSNCLLVVIDPQEKLMPLVLDSDLVTKNIILLVETAKVFNIPTVVTRQYSKGLGDIIIPIAKSLENFAHFIPDKLSFDCFQSEAFKEVVFGFKVLIICGVETHICVSQTVLSALSQDYSVHLASDAMSSRTKLDWEIGLNRMQKSGAIKSSTEMIVYELLKEAGNPEFKSLLPYLRDR